MENNTKTLTFRPDGVIFDCDSTLVGIEGIDELAKYYGKEDEVKTLTRMAMEGKIRLEDVYEKRLELILPSRETIQGRLAEAYLDTLNEGAKSLCDALDENGIRRAIVSGGLYDAILPLADYLNFSPEDLYAVSLEYDTKGFYNNTVHSPLTTSKGKMTVVEEWKRFHNLSNVVIIGDGGSDLAALGSARAMIGYGYYADRPNVRSGSTLFSTEKSLYALLPLLRLDSDV